MDRFRSPSYNRNNQFSQMRRGLCYQLIPGMNRYVPDIGTLNINIKREVENNEERSTIVYEYLRHITP